MTPSESQGPHSSSGDGTPQAESPPRGDEFDLFDLRVTVVATDRPMVCDHLAGDFFEVRGEHLSLPPGQTFSLYALAAILPLLPAKQRTTERNDWMTTDHDIACPDPNCGARFRIERTGRRTFRHGEVTATRLDDSGGSQDPGDA